MINRWVAHRPFGGCKALHYRKISAEPVYFCWQGAFHCDKQMGRPSTFWWLQGPFTIEKNLLSLLIFYWQGPCHMIKPWVTHRSFAGLQGPSVCKKKVRSTPFQSPYVLRRAPYHRPTFLGWVGDTIAGVDPRFFATHHFVHKTVFNMSVGKGPSTMINRWVAHRSFVGCKALHNRIISAEPVDVLLARALPHDKTMGHSSIFCWVARPLSM